jgi:uncharacterized membrane protein
MAYAKSFRNVFVSLVLAASGWAVAVPTYTVEVLQMPAGTTFSIGLHVNNRGDLVGRRTDAAGEHFFFKPSGLPLTTIPVPDGGTITAQTGINDAAQVVGTSSVGAFIWSQADGWTTLQVPAGYVKAVPTAINNKGTVVGYVTIEGQGDVNLNRRMFSWTKADGMRVVQRWRAVIPAAINDKGKLAVTAYYDGFPTFGNEAIYVDPKQGYRRLGDLVGSSNVLSSAAVDVNSKGSVVGTADDPAPGNPATFLWTKRPGFTLRVVGSSTATGIMDTGDIVGNISGGGLGTGVGYIWIAELDQWFYLTDRLAPGSPNVTSILTIDVSSNGIVTGSAETFNFSPLFAVILTPVSGAK